MKKTIIILILVVYVASVAVVNFFGLEVKIHDGIVYVQSIKCDSITLLDGENEKIEAATYWSGVPIFIFDFTPSATNGGYTKEESSIMSNPNVIQLNLDVLPHNADVSSFHFEFDEEAYEDAIVFRDDINAFVFLVPNRIITITVTSTDGSNITTTVKILGRVTD